jgi:hypothetical protein
MTKLKRDCIKYVRDRAKARYEKGDECFICGATEELDFHHFYSLTPLLNRWLQKTGNDPEDVMEWRDTFIAEHSSELYDEAVTICHSHHLKLHSIYGKNPDLFTAPKQKRWVNIRREKEYGSKDRKI